MYRYELTSEDRRQTELKWKVENIEPYQELIVSWNGFRPSTNWVFSLNLTGEWLKYAEWGKSSQQTFQSQGSHSETFQDIAFVKNGASTQFEIKVEGDLSELYSLYANTSVPSLSPVFTYPAHQLTPVQLRSQLALDHPRSRDLCSPVATSTAIGYLLSNQLDPLLFAEKVHDRGFDIYGNWILNTAQAYVQLEGRFRTFVERLPNFSALYNRLVQNLPVVVSVKGHIPGAPIVYHSGHLICVIGYAEGNVICIDSSFPADEQTLVRYELSDFLRAWGARKNLAYLFEPI